MPISVVIPTLNSGDDLPACLAALHEGQAAGMLGEVIISDGGSVDDTLARAAQAGGQVICGAASRGGQLRRGCAAATGDWLLICHADTRLQPGWAGAARAHMASGQAGWFRLRFDRGGRFVAGWANLRSRAFGLPYGDQGLLLPRALYEAAGGYPDQPLMEDVALARALRGRLRGIDAVAETSARRYRAQGWLRRGARNLWTLARYFAGVSPERLAEAYRR